MHIEDIDATPRTALTVAAIETTVDTDNLKETTQETHSGITNPLDTIATTTSEATVSPTHVDEGEDPSQAALLIPERTVMDWVAYTVSLNYNRLATSPLLSPITRWHWFDRIPNTNIILGAVPSQTLIQQLFKDQHLRDVINMCAEFQGHLTSMKELGVKQCWIPTRDFSTPTVKSIWVGVRYTAKQAEDCQGQMQEPNQDHGLIYLHCKAGRGRSATVALCWLVYAYKLTAVQAQGILLKARGQVDKNIYLHPEVITFCQQVQEQEDNHSLVRKPWPEIL
ncbi:hypothetical protein BG011_007556 [Mortierella polycephala]|uniref:Protein-tyrosine-phosphatase n=1 Tax=Mortierella polycephala TaxID=41804 RepID=A0A9P6PRU2_9FUNG|nr:hypothetical protein BG011_007556 [Mortierella polycephala]